jgi:DNA (cytosine-5)-methyltransferase 1
VTAYYNECDPYAAQWLRNLISAGHVAPGFVDERPIQQVEAFELAAYTQCHFFAGIGIWSYALRQAGWSDDRPIWTGSCPCQPFSNSGTKKGFSDERHLWPYWYPLIEQRNPTVIVGEQVASKDGLGWLDLVSTNLEASSYAFGATDLCAAGLDGAHIRQRLYFVALADALCRGAQPISGNCALPEGQIISLNGDPSGSGLTTRDGGAFGGLAEPESVGRGTGFCDPGPGEKRFPFDSNGGAIRGMGDTDASRTEIGLPKSSQRQEGYTEIDDDRGDRLSGPDAGRSGISGVEEWPGAPMLGRHAADWLFCRDGKWRPVGPGTFPLAHAAPSRVGRLRAYGNALDAETATEFCRTVKEICDGV